MNKPKIINAIVSLKADAKVLLQNENYNTIIWEDGNPTGITKVQIVTELERLNTKWTAQAYARNRATGYPSIPDQLDEIYHNGIDSWKAVIKVTKDKYPKG